MERKEDKRRKLYLLICLLVNFSILFIYKYLNFATESVFGALSLCGLRMEVPHFELLLPVGISFYTFQAVGYTIDVYRGNIKAERNLLTYALFVSFFPQLVAGPIERAKNLLPQFHNKIKFDADTCIEGLKLMIWGYFMKLCIAENVAPYVNAVYNNMEHHNGTSVMLASFFFTFQIYCDFCGYSLIAIGAARCMGYKLMTNFNHPYLTRSMKDFWRRWHISLSTWFMDYVYIPLGGSRCSELKHYRNLFVTLLVSGIWHGANWTFIVWGGYHGILLVLSTLRLKLESKRKKVIDNRIVKAIRLVCETVGCFVLAVFGWIFFRANSLGDAFLAIKKIFTEHGLLYNGEGKPAIALPLVLIVLMMLKEMKDEYHWHLPDLIHNRKMCVAYVSTAAMIVLILLCASFEGGQFIYFQF
ncbi:MAG: MBOAT family protein [Prevotella sp.]|nr:MBOAT family protein [Prevotella sp.]